MSEDAELLRLYAADHSEDAFAELIQRHVDLVYSAALRRVGGDRHRAEDVTQQVFAELARQAKGLATHPALVGWLYTTTRRAALRAIRTEQRRAAREQEANAMNELLRESPPEPDWDRLRPVLEDAMDELGETDRHAVLLRYFQNRSLRDVGSALGLNENAARMRVDRAVDKLRDVLRKRGVATSSALAAVISANAVQLAPAHLTVTLAATSLAAATAGTGTITLLHLMTATQVKIGLTALVMAGAATVLVVQHQAQEKLRDENGVLTRQVAQLKTDNDGLAKRLDAQVGTGSADQSGADSQREELLRLRGEVGVLRRQNESLTKAVSSSQTSTPRQQTRASSEPSAPLPPDYPKTPDLAAQRIFEAWGRGDWETFLTNYGQPGVPREMYEQAFTAEFKSNLLGMQIISVGQPTNGFYPGHFFIPYEVQFQNGETHSHRLSIKQDPASQRYYFDGGF
jgi:RNA polymerase sigma factor (sigma-70 family)